MPRGVKAVKTGEVVIAPAAAPVQDSIEAKIAKLLDEAEPLRALDDDDPEKDKLAAIVDEINALRAEQAKS